MYTYGFRRKLVSDVLIVSNRSLDEDANNPVKIPENTQVRRRNVLR